MTRDIRVSTCGIWVASVPWPEVQARLKRGARAILPIAAGAKEHGYHLPMGTDFLQAEWLASALSEVANIAIWPIVSYGFYPAFVDYPGSCSLSRATFVATIGEILQDIYRAGANAIAVLNTGISTIPALEEVLAKRHDPIRFDLIHCYGGPRYRAVVRELEQQARGGHADELETSIMLAIAPDQVHLERAESSTATMIPGPLNRTNPEAPNYSPSGVYGDPRLATQAKGERLVRAILEDVLERLDDERRGDTGQR